MRLDNDFGGSPPACGRNDVNANHKLSVNENSLQFHNLEVKMSVQYVNYSQFIVTFLTDEYLNVQLDYSLHCTVSIFPEDIIVLQL